jgi:site-specific DNA recombinase
LSRGARKKAPSESKANREIRCAIYTRKSTDEGLDQDFNSLDAQRESAEAFVESQKLEGWIVLPDRYDDGGFSGGNMERPALNKLLSDVDAGDVDCIVVYKVDRLSRSLLDFARIMEILDHRNVSFVSVTQQFSTTNSMGRLTLNILLSFAQFEREIIAERTRDKMSAARRKGKWVGGNPILGYDVDPQGGKININEAEAARAREIFDLYKERPSLIATVHELNNRGWGTKRWVTRKGRERGGNQFNKHNLRYFLSNISYIGKVRYKGAVYEGEHEAIIEEETFWRVQDLLKRNGRGGSGKTHRYDAFLKGLLCCTSCGTAMIHTVTARRQNVRYRYYVCSRAMKQGRSACPTKSLPANEIERFVVDRIRNLRSDPNLFRSALEEASVQNAKRVDGLSSEQMSLKGRIEEFHAEERSLVKSMVRDSGKDSAQTNRLADLQDRIRRAERDIARIQKEIDDLDGREVNANNLSAALSIFETQWETFSPDEKARVMQRVLIRVGYDGHEGKVAITFRPSGIIALAQEVDTGRGKAL